MRQTKFLDKTGNHKLLNEEELIEISALLNIQGYGNLSNRVIDHLTRTRIDGGFKFEN